MRRRVGFLAAVLGLIGAVVFLSQRLAPTISRWLPPTPAPVPRQAHEAEYEGSDRLPLRFHHPWDWPLQEERGRVEPYEQIRILGPRSDDGTYTAYLVVRRRPLPASDEAGPRLRQVIDRYLMTLYPGSVVRRDPVGVVDGAITHGLTVAYTIPPRHRHGAFAQAPITVMTRTVFLQRDTSLYELVYSAPAREYARYAGTFERLLETLRFH